MTLSEALYLECANPHRRIFLIWFFVSISRFNDVEFTQHYYQSLCCGFFLEKFNHNRMEAGPRLELGAPGYEPGVEPFHYPAIILY